MRIELELPEWTEERHIYVMAGIELVAYKYLNQPWKVKTGRCNMCGKCCSSFRNDSETIINGTCINLVNDGPKRICKLGVNRPWNCCEIGRAHV